MTSSPAQVLGHSSPLQRRVLIAEDEFVVSMLIEDVLIDLGYAVVGPFDTVSTALDIAQHEPLDLGLLDVNLRGEVIFPVAEALEARAIPFLLLSGYGDLTMQINRPTWRMCPKPFSTAELTRLILELLGAT